MHRAEQERVHQPLDHGEPKKAEEEHAAGREETVRVERAIARVPIDDSAREENPQRDVGAAGADDDDRPRAVVHEGAQVVDDRREADDGRLERDADAGGLVGEFLHPFVVDAVRRGVGRQAAAEVLDDHRAHRERERQCHRARQQPHADQDGRRAVDAPDAVEKRHANDAHDSTQSSSHTSQVVDHFAAACRARGASDLELLVRFTSSSSTWPGSASADCAAAARV